METCPYCRKVMNFLDENNIDYNKIDITNSENHRRLLELGGKDQVPFMVDNDIKMYESSDIIDYFKNK
jgi:glutaredoxin